MGLMTTLAVLSAIFLAESIANDRFDGKTVIFGVAFVLSVYQMAIGQ